MYQILNQIIKVTGIRTLKRHPVEPMVTRRAYMTVAEIYHTLGRQKALIEELRKSNLQLEALIQPAQARQVALEREQRAIDYERERQNVIRAEKEANRALQRMRAMCGDGPMPDVIEQLQLLERNHE